MSSDQPLPEMNIENLKLKIESQANLIRQLTVENEELYHQFNHLMIRNGKMLKRIDDLQKIIDDLHIRVEELQLINGNMMNLNDSLRKRNLSGSANLNDMRSLYSEKENNKQGNFTTRDENSSQLNPESVYNMDDLYNKWKNFPGQIAQNAPNLRKQVLMLVHLYNNRPLSANDLFRSCDLGGVTGARYVAVLKKFGLIRYTGARKKGFYEMTENGNNFIEGGTMENPGGEQAPGLEIPHGIPVKASVKITRPEEWDEA